MKYEWFVPDRSKKNFYITISERWVTFPKRVLKFMNYPDYIKIGVIGNKVIFHTWSGNKLIPSKEDENAFKVKRGIFGNYTIYSRKLIRFISSRMINSIFGKYEIKKHQINNDEWYNYYIEIDNNPFKEG